MAEKRVQIGREQTPNGFWTYIQRSAGELPTAPLSYVLNWIFEQLSFGHFQAERDKNGDIISLTIGKRVPRQTATLETAGDDAKERFLAVNVAGVLAQARESGIEPQYYDLSKRAGLEITEGGLRNTEFHYSFELIKVLGRLNKKTFKLVAPPIIGVAPESVRSYLREASRCWLYGFYGASIALSRACLEEALKCVLYPALSTTRAKTPELKDLIREAGQKAKLDGCMIEVARLIQKAGNKFLHGETMTETQSREVLDGTRSIVEQLFST